MKHFRFFILPVLTLVVIVLLSGCTLRFKATDVEYDGGMSGVLQIDGVDVCGIPVVKLSTDSLFFPADFEKHFFADSR